ncbi:hypothetical protein E2C01_072789 [Portunus trituberculatus]|uniref:Uncharacterized protein n=1 Tax=Portunus trituberculatus TaxID=210409 RepID=A0A5B7I841_PORTR|nr:hypothetical protein [Portunus trituberculatus]
MDGQRDRQSGRVLWRGHLETKGSGEDASSQPLAMTSGANCLTGAKPFPLQSQHKIDTSDDNPAMGDRLHTQVYITHYVGSTLRHSAQLATDIHNKAR